MTSEARLIHYELAGRYSIKAAQCAPFMLPVKGPATEGERIAIQVATPPASKRLEPPGDLPDGPESERR